MGRWHGKLRHTVTIIFLVSGVLFAMYQLYSAWMFQQVTARNMGWVSLDSEPIGFWLCPSLCVYFGGRINLHSLDDLGYSA
jgi:hypothetical protein